MLIEFLTYPVDKFSYLVKILRDEKTPWRRNLILISIAQFITMVGMGAVIPFMPLYIRELGIADPGQAKLWSGLIFAGPYMLSIIFVPVWGSLGDKYGRKMMIIRAIIGLAIVMTLMGFAQTVWQILILRIIQGAASGFLAASLSFVSADAPRERSGFAIGILQSSQSAGNIMGPLIGGVLSDVLGLRPVFFVTGLLCFSSAVLIQFYVRELNFESNKDKKVTAWSNFRFVVGKTELRNIMLMIILSQAGILFANPIMPYFLEYLQAPKPYLSTITGIFVGIVGFFSIIFAPRWGRRNDRKAYQKTILMSTLIIGVVLLLHAFVPHYLYLLPLRIILGIFMAAVVPTLYTALSKRAPEDKIGGIMGIASSAMLFGALISYLLCGALSNTLGFSGTFLLSAALVFISSIIAFKKN